MSRRTILYQITGTEPKVKRHRLLSVPVPVTVNSATWSVCTVAVKTVRACTDFRTVVWPVVSVGGTVVACR